MNKEKEPEPVFADLAALRAAQRPLLAEVCAINEKYGYGVLRHRAWEDVKREKVLNRQMAAMRDAYDRQHPVPPLSILQVAALRLIAGWALYQYRRGVPKGTQRAGRLTR